MSNISLQVTLPGAVTGDLEFPSLSRWGIGVDPELVDYFDALDEAGTNLTIARINAWIAWSDTLKAAGVWGKLMEVYPIFGDNAASARIPVLRRLSGSSALLEYPQSNADNRFVLSDGQVVRLLGSGTATPSLLQVVCPVTLAQLRTKSEAFANQNATRYGRTIVHGNVGAAGFFRSGAYGLRVGGGDFLDSLRCPGAAPATYDLLAVAGHNPGARNRPTGALAYSSLSLGASHFSDYTGAFSGPTYTANANVPERVATAFSATLKPGVNCQTSTTNDSTISYFPSENTEAVNWMSFDDGTIASQAQQEAYRAAIAALRTALYP